MRQRFRLTMKLIENILFDVVTVIVYGQVIPTVLQELDLQGAYWSHKHSLWMVRPAAVNRVSLRD